MAVQDYEFVVSDTGHVYLAKKSRSKKLPQDSRLITDKEVFAMLEQCLLRNYFVTGEKDMCIIKGNKEAIYATFTEIGYKED